MTNNLRVLCLDHEGGRGGSSISLFSFLKAMDGEGICPSVWCVRPDLLDRYSALDIPAASQSWLPRFRMHDTFLSSASSARNASRNVVQAIGKISELSRELKGRVDLIHANHLNMQIGAYLLARHLQVPVTLHMRSRIMGRYPAIIQNLAISWMFDGLVFITPNEREHFQRFGGKLDGPVIYNPLMPLAGAVNSRSEISNDPRLKIAKVGNFAWRRGFHRLVEVARCLQGMGIASRVVFVVIGDTSMPRDVPAPLREVARKGGTFEDYVESCGLASMFQFLGHVSDPLNVIAACDCIVRTTLDDDPWGRDVIEAMMLAKPVISIGTWDGFVKQSKTGVLISPYSPNEFADAIVQFVHERKRLEEMGRAGAKHIATLCDPGDRAHELAAFWRQIAARHTCNKSVDRAGTPSSP